MEIDLSEHTCVMCRLSDLEKELQDIKFDVDRILDKLTDMNQLIMKALESCADGYKKCASAYQDCETAFDAIPDRVNQGVFH